MSGNKYHSITNPTDLGLIPLEEYLQTNCFSYKDISLLNNKVYNVDDSVNLKGDQTRLMIIKDYIGIVTVNRKDKKVSVAFGLGGVPVDCAEVETISNNRTGEAVITKYEIPIKCANSEKIKLAVFAPEKIYDVKEFRKETGCLCNFNIPEVLEFIKQETENVNKFVAEFTNCGRIDFDKNDWLWGNAVFIDGKLYREIDKYRNIKNTDNRYIRAQKRVRRNMPMYYHNAKPISKVLTDLFDNVYSAWNGAIEPPFAICFMSLSAFYNRFWPNEGFGTVGFIGETEGGKTEIFNRMLFLNADNLNFSPENFKYFGKAKEELSCILPHILKYSPDEIKNKHERNKNKLKMQYANGSDRMLSQIAIALTGYEVLSEIAGTQLTFPQDKLNQYVMDCISRFKSYKNPIEKLLEAFPVLIWNGHITSYNQYSVERIDGKIILKFHKVAVFKAYNRYFVEDKSEEIRTSAVKPVKSELYEIIKFNQSININDNRGHGVVLDITKHPYAEAILSGRYTIK